MAKEVYRLIQFRPKDARFELSEEEFSALREKMVKVWQECGRKVVVQFRPVAGKWRRVVIASFPSMEAWEKCNAAMLGPDIRSQKYWVWEDNIGFKPEDI